MNSFIRETPARAEVIHTMSNLKPTWDEESKELRFGDVVIKRYRWPAPNQIRVIEAFQEQGWPNRIDDPLPQSRTRAKTKLHDTIKCLNQNHQQNPENIVEKRALQLIKFRGDGTGEGVLLEILPAGLALIARLNLTQQQPNPDQLRQPNSNQPSSMHSKPTEPHSRPSNKRTGI